VGAQYGDIGVKLGRGNGTFGRWINANSPSSSATALAVGEFDGKNLDAVVNDYDDAWVLLGDGKGGFPNYTWLDAGGNLVVGFAVGDFNGDGKQDIAALVDIPGQNSDSSEVYLYLGNGDGTFQPPRQFSVSPLGPVAILTGDLNGDGKPDLVVLSSYLHDGVGRGFSATRQRKGRLWPSSRLSFAWPVSFGRPACDVAGRFRRRQQARPGIGVRKYWGCPRFYSDIARQWRWDFSQRCAYPHGAI
jgi:hypothetical protein